jgi:DNA-binding SARP family transcriptional activator/tetratricopeptide (TPR) repeat protein
VQVVLPHPAGSVNRGQLSRMLTVVRDPYSAMRYMGLLSQRGVESAWQLCCVCALGGVLAEEIGCEAIRMWFGVLGPLLVRDRDSVVGVGAGRQRVLLAALLVRAGTVVPTDALAEVVWDGAPPDGAVTTLRSHVMRLRQVLGPAAGARVVTRYPGYVVQAAEEEVDLLRFRRLCRDGGAAARARGWGQAWDVLGEGLGLWRGEPLADVPSDLLRREQVPGLEELRLQAAEWRVDAGLELGRHGELVAELLSLAAGHPLRERFHGQLMLALVRCGRQAEALEAYQSAREVLVKELGTEPGADLRELHQRILAGDPALAVPEHAVPTGSRSAAVVPRELPAPVTHFTGRAGELAALTGLLDRTAGQAPSAIVISAIGGTAGAGKTALAVHWAHQAADRFPDGQLYVNLRGYDSGRPTPPADVLAGFLRALGVPGQDIPPEEDERAARYRSLLAGKKMLIVLDNAGSAGQVRPLLPGTGACTVLVTSRDALAGLVARDGATRLELDLLPPAEAIGLLRALIGQRVDDDPGAAGTLAGQCCRLPLALRVAAELAAARAGVPFGDLVGELADQRKRLDLLQAGGDPRTAVRTVFSWSYRHLDDDTSRAFRLAGLHPGPDFEAYAAAALTDTSLKEARWVLDVLARAHLIQPAGPGRYGMHDLLHAYACELAIAEDGEYERRAALTRLFDHYLYTAAAAMDTLFPAERRRRPRIPRPATPVPSLADPAAARDWLDGQRAALVAAAGHTAVHGWPGHATRLAATLASYLLNGGHLPEALTIFGHALGAARRTGDRAAEATALNAIGYVDGLLSRFQQAADHHRQALVLFREAGDRTGEARALSNLGLAETALGHYGQAARHQQEAVAIFGDIGDRFGEARALGNLGLARRQQGRYQEAAGYHRQTLELFREIGDREGEGWALTRLGAVDLRLGSYQEAAAYLRQALALFQGIGDTVGESQALARLGDAYAGPGRYEQAAGIFEQALAMSREIRDPGLEAEALNGLGEVLFRTGDAGKARTYHAAALQLASETGSPLEDARAHSGLARACQATGDPVQARHHWQLALTRYTAIGAPEAGEIRARLARAGDDGDKPTA